MLPEPALGRTGTHWNSARRRWGAPGDFRRGQSRLRKPRGVRVRAWPQGRRLGGPCCPAEKQTADTGPARGAGDVRALPRKWWRSSPRRDRGRPQGLVGSESGHRAARRVPRGPARRRPPPCALTGGGAVPKRLRSAWTERTERSPAPAAAFGPLASHLRRSDSTPGPLPHAQAVLRRPAAGPQRARRLRHRVSGRLPSEGRRVLRGPEKAPVSRGKARHMAQ